MSNNMDSKDLFNKLKKQLLMLDPVAFSEANLTLDGKPFRLTGNGYRPFAEVYRYIGIKALEPNSKPLIIVKGRQVGATTMASALEMYFMGCGLFGTSEKPPIRIIHAFPQLELAAAYSKTKLNQIISSSVSTEKEGDKKTSLKPKSFMQSLLDQSTSTNDSLHFKQFTGGNHIWIESVGLDGDRIMGRQLCLETDLPTPNGFIKLKDLKEGDKLFDEQGNICSVTKLHPINYSPEAYKITFDDGTTVDACAEHLWLTYTKSNRSKKTVPKVKNTREILRTLKVGKEFNHSIPCTKPLNYEEKDLILAPYIFGLWLGDGDQNGRIESADPEVFKNVSHHVLQNSINKLSNFSSYPSKSCSYRIDGLTTKLKELKQLQNTHNKTNVVYNKHIPKEYMESSFNQRLSLLQGLLDSDGHCDKNGNVEFVQVRENLAKQVYQLILSLGIKAYFYKRGSRRYDVKYKYRIRFMTTLPVFRMKRKLKRIKLNQTKKSSHRFIVDVSPIKSKPMRCITVDSPSHLFLITDKFIPTHNTADVLFFDECFPSNQKIATSKGKVTIRNLVKNHLKNKENPLILSFNEKTKSFEYKKIINTWEMGKKNIIRLFLCGKKIDCTSNHKFLTEFGWQEAQNIKPGTLIKTYYDTDKYIRSLNDDQYQIILGSFLGDGHIDNQGKSRYRLKVIHGKDQKEYCDWLSNIFDCKLNYIEKNGFSQSEAYKFQTRLFGLNKYFPKTKTSCPQWILDDIDVRGIAIWFMDDGSITRRWKNGMSGTISTCSFDEDSQKRFVEKFKSLNIECEYRKYNDNFYLIFNKNGLNNLLELISPYIHPNFKYKSNKNVGSYKWNLNKEKYGWLVLDKIVNLNLSKKVYDIEIDDNHNFILSPNTYGYNLGGPIAHNCQKTTGMAIGNSLKVLTTAKYGKPSKGVQVYFGTPRRKGSDFHKMWQTSSQQYYYLGCEKCDKHFPLYTPESDDWKNIWIHGYIVRCTHCGHEQNKLEAAERGKWVATKDPNDEDCLMVGFHLNQLYMPMFTREDIDAEMPGRHPINTERVYMNEVMGEFFQGDSSPITPEEIKEFCRDDRKFSARISPAKAGQLNQQIVVVGIDYGARADLEQLANPDKVRAAGQSFSTAVVLSSKSPGLLNIEFAMKFKRNDMESKKGIIDQLMRQYSVQLAVGDIGFSNDFSSVMHNIYGDRYLVSRAHNKVNGHVKFSADAFPKEIVFERDYYIGELYEQMKKGMIKFPYGDYEKVAWLIDHCCSMEIKPSISRMGGDPTVHYVKGSTPNDGFMALLNAYIAYKYIITGGFSTNNPILQQANFQSRNKPLILSGFIPRKF